MTDELRPRSIGEVLDWAVSTWRRNLLALFWAVLPFQLGAFVLYRGFAAAMQRWFPLFQNAQQLQTAVERGSDQAFTQLAIAGPAVVALVLLTLSLSWLTAVVVSHRALGLLAGGAGGRLRWGTSLIAFWLSMAWAAALGIAALAPVAGAIYGATRLSSPVAITAVIAGATLFGLLALTVIVLWYVLRFLVTPQVLAAEPTSDSFAAVVALRRSGALLSGRVLPGFLGLMKVRATVLVTVAAALLLAVGILVSVPELVLQAVYAHPFSAGGADLNAVPFGAQLAVDLLIVPVQALFAPLYPLFATALYLDVRVRREGLDLEQRLARLPPLEGA